MALLHEIYKIVNFVIECKKLRNVLECKKLRNFLHSSTLRNFLHLCLNARNYAMECDYAFRGPFTL